MTSLNDETRGIFDDLSENEIDAIVDYTRQHICFNQRDDVSSDGNVSTIAVIELRPPIKHTALKYLDDSGPAPTRNARVVLYRQVLAGTLYYCTNKTVMLLKTWYGGVVVLVRASNLQSRSRRFESRPLRST